ncbi:hypothetical protein BKA93DRAFT_830289 [Sparassis latifolia]
MSSRTARIVSAKSQTWKAKSNSQGVETSHHFSKANAGKSKTVSSTEEEKGDDAVDVSGDEDVFSLHSDALDDSDAMPKKTPRKRKAKTSMKSSPQKSPSKKKRRRAKESDEEDDGDIDLKDGQEIVGVVVQAPKTGRVPPGQISQNTFDFLAQLRKPECNDREWFKLYEPVYRLAEGEWKAFIEEFTPRLIECDPQIPHLPPKDVILRIYRDIRFSNDKTPYKTEFSAAFSRSGRKGIFAHFEPGGNSLLAAGAWCPGKNELATIRNNLLRSSARLRRVIAAPEFVKLFGPPKPNLKGGRQSIFGGDDELKVAPKGVEKTHKDIDLLKCRSFAVVHHFADSQVLAPDLMDQLCGVVKILQPFVHCLNDLMTLQDADDDDEEGSGNEGAADGEDGED